MAPSSLKTCLPYSGAHIGSGGSFPAEVADLGLSPAPDPKPVVQRSPVDPVVVATPG